MAHIHEITDSDLRFIVDARSRQVTAQGDKLKLIQSDHNSERLTFEMPRFVEGHDMLGCSKVEVHFVNIAADKKSLSADVYPVDDVKVCPDSDDVVIFSWLISGNATRHAGILSFLIKFTCLTGETVDYVWNTDLYSEITVGEGMNNGEAVIAEYADVLEKWKQEIFAEFTINFEAEKNAAIAEIEAKGVATLATIPEDYTALNNRCEKNASRIDRNDKRITNIEEGLNPDPSFIDDSVAYTKDVPENALPYAEIQKIGGMTRKCTNLIPYPYVAKSGSAFGSTYTIKGDGTIQFSGKPTSGYTVILCEKTLPAGTYYLNDGVTAAGINFIAYDIDGAAVLSYEGTFTISSSKKIRIYYLISVDFSGTATTVYPMLNEGGAKPYEPYFEGLRSAPVTELVSKGANLFGGEKFAEAIVASGGTKNEANGTVYIEGWQANNKIFFSEFIPNTQYTFILKYQSSTPSFLIVYTDGTTSSFTSSKDAPTSKLVVSTFGKSIKSFSGAWYTDTTFYYNECGIFKGVITEEDFKPYKAPIIFPIPSQIQALDGYGWGINESVYNYIDYEKKQFVKRVGVVDMGTFSWEYDKKMFYTSVDGMKSGAKVLTAPYTYVPYDTFNGQSDKVINAHWSYYQFAVNVKDSAYTDATTFKSAMSGVMLYYELATPEVTDISHLLLADNFIEVEGGGTITAVNEYKYAVPSTIEFQKEIE